MIIVSHLHKSFDGREILHDISASFEQGKVNLIIGQSGSGKTVLLKSIVGLHTIDSGEIHYDDILFSSLKGKELREIHKQVGMLFQGSALFDFATVEENVMFPMEMFTNMSKEEKRERVNFCLSRVNIVNSNTKYPSEISGGMQKRVAIARAIALNPKYFFCDEPNSGLDPQTSILIDNLIKDITEEYQMTTIVNTHDMNSVMGIGDKIMFVHNHQIWWEGSKDIILDSDNEELNDFVFASKIAREAKKMIMERHRQTL